MSSAKHRIWSGEMYEYHCQRGDKTVYILDRKTKPRIGQVITAYGSKWQVWYIEEGVDGKLEKEVDAYVFGSLAVHKFEQRAKSFDTLDEWSITSIEQGLKFPGKTTGLKAAKECAKQLDAMFAWNTFDYDNHKDVASEAKKVLIEWGVDSREQW